MEKFFTPDFFKFLLAFSLIILASFAVLIFFGKDFIHVEPTLTTENETIE